MPRLTIISDTHVRRWDQLPPHIKRVVEEAEWLIHCGDFTGAELLDELKRRARKFTGVCGNADSTPIWQELPQREFFEVEGKRLVIAHPHLGGAPFGIEDDLLAEFPNADIIIFGHTHEPQNTVINNTLFLNPGQSYSTSGTPASYAILTIEGGEVRGQIEFVSQ